MKTILFEGPSHTYLPEIPAYMRYLKEEYPEIKAFNANEIKEYSPMDFDVMWRFMGVDVMGKGRYVVHEYNSLSAGRFPHAKNLTKRLFNSIPNQRVYLNKMVRTGFRYNDNVPYGFRDMGIAAPFFEVTPKPEYDFVYAGSIHRGPEVLQMLDHFAENLTDATLFVIGATNPDVLAKYKHASNITFAGRVRYEEVAEYVAKGRYGLNLVPDRYPYNLQTATKVLEYCALNMPIVSMKYRWIEQFIQKRDAAVFWLNGDFSNLTLQNVEAFEFITPSAENRRWKDVIANSGIFDFLKQI